MRPLLLCCSLRVRVALALLFSTHINQNSVAVHLLPQPALCGAGAGSHQALSISAASQKQENAMLLKRRAVHCLTQDTTLLCQL